MPQVFASWSGGKDCCLALNRAIASGMEVRYLANTITDNRQRSCSHGLSSDIIRTQAEALGIPVIQRRTTRESYESVYIDMLKGFKREGIEGGVFGDIDFNAHLEWIERVCRAADITPHLPLWLESQDKLVREFINAGFKAVVVAAKPEFFGEEVLGRTLDRDFLDYLEELSKTTHITPCGEAGEFHTLVIDGPLFKKRVEVLEAKKVIREGRRFLDISSVELKDK